MAELRNLKERNDPYLKRKNAVKRHRDNIKIMRRFKRREAPESNAR